MTRLLVGGLLILILVVPRLLASPESPDATPTPSMPPQRLRPAEVARLRAQGRIHDIRAKDQDAVIGVFLLPDGNTYFGSYIEDRERGDFEEIGAWRGDYLTCRAAGCSDVTGDAGYNLALIYKAKYGWPPPPQTAPATPTPIPATPQPGGDRQALPPERLSAAAMQGEIVRGHVSLVNHPNGTVTGFLLDCPGEVIGGYLLETSTAEYVEVLAHRGETVDLTHGIADALNAAAAALVHVHGSETGWAASVPWTRAGTAASYAPVQRAELTSPATPIADAATTQANAAASAAAPQAAVASLPRQASAASPPSTSPAPPLLSFAGLLGLPLRLLRDSPFITLGALVALHFLWAWVQDVRKRARSHKSVAIVSRRETPALIPSTERVVITHEEHERAVAQAERRLLADKAKLERLNDEIEAEEQKFITKVADITRRM